MSAGRPSHPWPVSPRAPEVSALSADLRRVSLSGGDDNYDLVATGPCGSVLATLQGVRAGDAVRLLRQAVCGR
jgi:hypothetical protein